MAATASPTWRSTVMHSDNDNDNSSNCGVYQQASPIASIAHLSFATDLLFEVESVRTNCSQGLAAQGQLVAMLRSRVALEKQYAGELARMAQQPQFEELELGTAREALGRLKAQYLNSSVQHRALAQNLDEDVLKPIEELYTRNTQKAQQLGKLVHSLKKQAKAHEDAYKKDFALFEKQFREASVTFAAAMDAGFSSTAIEQQYHHQLMQMQTEEDPQWRNEQLSSDARGKQRASAVALQSSFNNNSQKLVNWLLASDQQRKDNLGSSAAAAIEVAELSRRKCQRSWRAVEQSRVDMFRALQSVLTEYQQMAEHRVANLAVNLRKHVVFESSALANEQYDWQMIAGKIESVDAESDVRDFILTHRLIDLPHMAVSDLCSNPLVTSIVQSPTSKTSRPLKRVPLEIGDVALRKIPIDREGNQMALTELLVTRASAARVHFVERAASTDPTSPSALRFDQLRVDCHSPARIAPLGALATAESVEGVSELRLTPAQDVALAIARAFELRTAQLTQQPQQLQRKSLSTPEQGRCEPENNGYEATRSVAECYSMPPSSTAIQSNDIVEDSADKVARRVHDDSSQEHTRTDEDEAALCDPAL